MLDLSAELEFASYLWSIVVVGSIGLVASLGWCLLIASAIFAVDGGEEDYQFDKGDAVKNRAD